MIDRYLLRYFLAVIDCGSFSKAAKQLHVAQPTLSVGIGKLERLLGASLFQRSSKRVHLTEAGSRLATHARRIESEFNLAEAAVLDMKPVRVMRIGVLSTYPMSQLADAIRRRKTVRTRWRGCKSWPAMSGSCRSGSAAARSNSPSPSSGRSPDRFSSESLFSERYALALPAAHPLADKPTIAAEELADNTMIVRRHCEVLSETSRHFTERRRAAFLRIPRHERRTGSGTGAGGTGRDRHARLLHLDRAWRGRC